VYIGNNKLVGADPETFRILGNSCYGKDKDDISWE
jgi:DKNYY family